METNENTFNFGGATEVVQPVQTDFPHVEKMETTEKLPAMDHQPDVNMVVDEGIKKPVEMESDVLPVPAEPAVTENNTDHGMNNTDSTPVVDEREPEPQPQPEAQMDDDIESPGKQSPAEPVEADGIDEPEVIPETQSTSVSQEHAPEDVEMKDDSKDPVEEQQPAEPEEPDSTPPEVDGVMNDVQNSEDEMKVEEVSGDSATAPDEEDEEEVKESSAEPLVEEPAEVDGPVDTEPTPDQDVKDGEEVADIKEDAAETKVEISDVTDKEEEPVEEKKSDEELLIEHLNTAYQCLDDFMKTKDEIKIKDCMSLLTEINSLTVKTVDSLKAFTAASKDVEKGHSSKKGKGRGKASTKQNKTTSKGDKNDIGGESDSPDPLEEVNLKEIKGLAVFAKWPNSGWFYPGVVRDLQLSDWKTTQNITVTFYDGLERDMKSINIFPAELIPTSSVLFDLDDETDMTVASIEREDNWVKYVVSGSGQPEVTKDFDKMAIKGAHMKTIKQAVESASPDNVNKTEPIVSGRRARGKSSVFNEDYVSTSSPRSTEKRKAKVEDSKSTPAKTPAKRKSSSKEDEAGDSTPSRSASKRRQVNGTKSMPRRAAKK